jgi:hypothetical protein
MHDFDTVSSAFVEMAHRIVWCSAASVDAAGRPRSRVLHPLWEIHDGKLIGWIATGPTQTKREHIAASPHLSLNYWQADHDTCVAECRASWCFDDETRTTIWQTFKTAPAPVGYDPAMIPGWDGPTSETFAVLRLVPWRLRVMPGTVLLAQSGNTLVWEESKA